MSSSDSPTFYKEFRCTFAFCPHHYKTKAGLKRHYLVHGVKPYKCPYCHQRFGNSRVLTDHAYVHTGGKPFVCDQEGCGRRFMKIWMLTLHQRKHSLLDLSESSSDGSVDCGPASCTFGTIETVFTQIAAFELPSYFYTKVLPIPCAWVRAPASPTIFG